MDIEEKSWNFPTLLQYWHILPPVFIRKYDYKNSIYD